MNHSFAFHFIAGKYEGGVYLIPSDKDRLLGRGAELDIVLVEDMVSRRHASLATHDNRLVLQDLHSTNGTFVNGERIEQCEIEPNDRLLIGTSILRVATADQIPTLLETHPELALSALPDRQESGSLVDLGVLELLRLLAGKRRTGLLDLEAGQERLEIVLVDGILTHASNHNVPGLPAGAALAQALGFGSGTYHFAEPAEGFERPTSFSTDNDATLKAATLEHSRLDALMKSDWPAAARLTLTKPQPGAWSQAHFTPAQLDALQLALTLERVGPLLANAPQGALSMIDALDALCQRGILQKQL